MLSTNWQREDVTAHYLDQVRGAIPFGSEQVKMMLEIVAHFKPNPKKVMDLGCGNGFLAELLLKTYPEATAVLVDHSEAMIKKAQVHMDPYKDRCQIFHGDFSQHIQQYAGANSLDCIVSGFAIHHLSHEMKKTLYQDIYKLLSPGGVFINIEHTASATPEIEKLYDQLFINHLAAYNKRDRREVAAEYLNRPDKEDNILASADQQVGWLRNIGFSHADCYFKWMELAVFGGVK